MSQLASQLGANYSLNDVYNTPSGNIKNDGNNYIIKLSKRQVRDKGEKIKGILRKYPGEKQVYLLVEGATIKTNFKVDDNSDLDNELGGLGIG